MQWAKYNMYRSTMDYEKTLLTDVEICECYGDDVHFFGFYLSEDVGIIVFKS